MKSSVCPQCLNAYSLAFDDSLLYVCPHCQAHIQTDKDIVLKKGIKLPQKTYSGIEIGKNITLRGQSVKAIGRLVYRGQDNEDTWYWEEVLLTEGKKLYWLEYEPELARFSVFQPVEEPTSLPKGRVVDDHETGSLVSIEGEIPWLAKIGEKVSYTTYDLGGNKLYSIEQDVDGEEHFQGTILDSASVQQTFGIAAERAPVYRSLSGNFGLSGRSLFVSVLLGLVFLLSLVSSLFERVVSEHLIIFCPATTPSSQSCVRPGENIGPIMLTRRVPGHGIKIGRITNIGAFEARMTLVRASEVHPSEAIPSYSTPEESAPLSTIYSDLTTFRLQEPGSYYIHVESHNAQTPIPVYVQLVDLPLGTYLPKLTHFLQLLLS